MLKIAKKLTRFVCALIIAITSVLCVSCSKDNTADNAKNKVMALGFNPQIEFVLDADNKVISVTALNEEGNLIISATAFQSIEGKSAEDAVKIFLEVSEEYGFLVSGSASVDGTTNEFSISISGETVKELYDNVKGEIQSYCSSLDIQATVADLKQITKEELEALVAECAPYLKAAEIKAMEYAELVKELEKSHKETAELYSQELKKAYYEAKTFAIQQAEIELLKSKANAIAQYAIDAVNGVYVSAIENVEKIRNEMLLDEDSIYQKALESFRVAKAEYLNYRNYVAGLEQNEITTQISTALASYQALVDSTEQALLQAGVTANTALDTAKAGLTTAYDAVLDAIEQASVKASDFALELSVAKTLAVEALATAFETQYNEVVTRIEADWNEMRTLLQQGYQVAE